MFCAARCRGYSAAHQHEEGYEWRIVVVANMQVMKIPQGRLREGDRENNADTYYERAGLPDVIPHIGKVLQHQR